MDTDISCAAVAPSTDLSKCPKRYSTDAANLVMGVRMAAMRAPVHWYRLSPRLPVRNDLVPISIEYVKRILASSKIWNLHLLRRDPSQPRVGDADRASRDAGRTTSHVSHTYEIPVVGWTGIRCMQCILGGQTMPVVFNWRSPIESDYLKQLDRPGFAWEFLRRNPGYQEDYETIVRGAASDAGSGGVTSEALAWRWGLAFPG
jgi:hypothetical protein